MNNEFRHAGDLGNVLVRNGQTIVDITDTVVSLDPQSPEFIGDKAIVFHQLMDDGNPERDSSSTGAAGARLGCCLIKANQELW